jgi:hypothetical protein
MFFVKKCVFCEKNVFFVKKCFVKKCFVGKCFVGKSFVNKCFLLKNVFPSISYFRKTLKYEQKCDIL